MNVEQGFRDKDIYKDHAKVGYAKNWFLGYLQYKIVLDKTALSFENVSPGNKTAHN